MIDVQGIFWRIETETYIWDDILGHFWRFKTGTNILVDILTKVLATLDQDHYFWEFFLVIQDRDRYIVKYRFSLGLYISKSNNILNHTFDSATTTR